MPDHEPALRIGWRVRRCDQAGPKMIYRRHVAFWVAALARVHVALLWLLSDVLLPFVAGLALAYLLDPLADRLERLRHRPQLLRRS